MNFFLFVNLFFSGTAIDDGTFFFGIAIEWRSDDLRISATRARISAPTQRPTGEVFSRTNDLKSEKEGREEEGGREAETGGGKNET